MLIRAYFFKLEVDVKTVGDVGELAVVERIKKFLPDNADILVGAGDDCAVVRSASSDEDLVLTSDPVIEGVHFTSDTDSFSVGHKAVGRVLSDLAAMGAEPRWILINVVTSPKTLVTDIDEIYRGANKIASRFGMVIVGGDVAEGKSLELHVFGMGVVPHEKAVQRKGAVPGDFLFVTGALGGSILGRHLNFEPRVEQGMWLRDWATSMMDVSDGLASDLRRLLKMSDVGCELQETKIPISDVLIGSSDVVAPLDHALYDGEDFELLFTIAADDSDEFCRLWNEKFDLKCTCIGVITDQKDLLRMVDRDGGSRGLVGRGYEHFGSDGESV